MRYILILIALLTLSGCDNPLKSFALVTKNGVIANRIDSRADCELIIAKFKIDGVCIVV